MKTKYGLKSDETLGYITTASVFQSVDFGNDHIPSVREYKSHSTAYPDLLTITPETNLTHVDWFRATAVGEDILFAIEELQSLIQCDETGLVIDTDIIYSHSDKGLHGYPYSIRVSLVTDGGLVNLGSIAYQNDPLSSNCGVMLDLSGQFFTWMTQYHSYKIRHLYDYLSGYGFRISRIDIALDLLGQYCRKNKITVPRLSYDAKHNDLLKSEFSRNKQVPNFDTLGDWSGMTHGEYSYLDYKPDVHSPRGLTFNYGSRKSPNFFRVYEKSKQLIATADLGDDHDLDKWAVRIEQEIKRDKDGSPIPFEMLLCPDAFFGLGRPALRDMLIDYASSMELRVILQAHKERFKKNVQLSLKKKIYWARRSYGRLIRSLITQGMDAVDIVDSLVREQGLKDFVHDLSDFSIVDLDTDYIVSSSLIHDALPLVSNELADRIRSYYGLSYN